uniref:CCHC-type domain-containing protein n=1 Tax=Anopheles maculatus TaxID=74869 RepID=A0A182SBD8_9DIPT
MPEAILVSSSDAKEDVLRRLKQDTKLKVFGEKVERVRRTRLDDLIFELKSGEKASEFKSLVEESVGVSGKVRVLNQTETVECRDVDLEAKAEQVVAAFREQFDCGSICLEAKLKPSFNGTQTAYVKLPAELAATVIQAGKVKIEWSSCPVRILPPNRRCFRCWATDHISRDCKGPDRSELCLRCGEKGHQARSCRQAPRCVLCAPGANKHQTSGPLCPAAEKSLSWR